MKKVTRAVLGCVLIASVILVSVVHAEYLGKKNPTAYAATEFFVDKDGKIQSPKTDKSQPLGTESNPFFVLEIVPFDEMAEFGYHIAGCEPANVEKMGWLGQALPDNGALIELVAAGASGYWMDELPEWLAEDPAMQAAGRKENVDCLGIMTRTAGRGNYEALEIDAYIPKESDSTGPFYKQEGSEYVEDPYGYYIKVKKYVFSEKENGGYTFERHPVNVVKSMQYEEKIKYTDGVFTLPEEGGSVKLIMGNAEAMVKDYVRTYEHKNIFLKYAVGLAYKKDETTGLRVLNTNEDEVNALVAAYQSKVYTVTPEDLNMNVNLIADADMIVFSGKRKTMEKMTAEEKSCLRDELFRHDTSTTLGSRILNQEGATFVSNPIDWPVVVEIYKKAITGHCPIVMDTFSRTEGDVLTDQPGTNDFWKAYMDGTVKEENVAGVRNNMAKLLLMLFQMDAATMIDLYANVDGKLFAEEYTPGTAHPETSFGSVATGATLKDGTTPFTTGTFLFHQEEPVSYWDVNAATTLRPYHLVESSPYGSDVNLDQICHLLGISYNAPDSEFFNWMSEAMQDSVRDTSYLYRGNMLMTTTFHEDDEDAKNLAESDDPYGVKLYDFLESITGHRPGKVDTADVIYYLLNHDAFGTSIDPAVPVYANLRVLDIEPSSAYSSVINENYFKLLFRTVANVDGNVTLDRINTSELIGKKVDFLSDYDLIYIGTNLATGDVTMPDGFVYAHTGKEFSVSDEFKGLQGMLGSADTSVENHYAYSGNDLTRLVYNQLEAYRTAGYPIMFGAGFFNNTDLTSAAVSAKVDHNSYVYELANRNIPNAVSEDALVAVSDAVITLRERNKFKTAIQSMVKNRTILDFISLPNEYNDLDAGDADNYLNPTAGSTATLKFKFSVNAPSTKSYDVRLFIDNNGDGTFSDSEDMTNSDMRIDGSTAYKQLTGGGTYEISKTIDERFGSIHWKLELYDTMTVNGKKTKVVAASRSGISAIKKYDSAEDLPILQIEPEERTYFPVTVKLPEMSEVTAYYADEAASTLAPTTKDFIKGIYNSNGTSKINGLNITFTRKTQAQIISDLTASGKSAAELTVEDFKKYLKKYKMVVSGFSDMYNGIDDDRLLEALEKYIEMGNAVLFTHDNSSFYGATDWSDKTKGWSEEMTKTFRSQLGMDRYGVMSNPASALLAERPDFPWETSASSSARNLLNVDNRALIQGYTNAALYKYLKYNGENNMECNKVKVVNEGAVTSYPYDIPGEITVARTHAQYFQLDMEAFEKVVHGDGSVEERQTINVWCTLDGNDGDLNHDGSISWQDGDSAVNAEVNQFYQRNRGDVRNNYYIYNIGNVTYSGVGHNGELTEDEVKLFINTFVAAYRAAASVANVMVKNDDAVKVGNDYFLSVDVDASDAGVIIGTEDIATDYTPVTITGEAKSGLTYTKGTTVEKTSKRVKFYIKDANTTPGKYALKATVRYNGADVDLAIFKEDGTFVGLSTTFEKGSPTSNGYYVDVPLNMNPAGNAFEETKLTLTISPWYSSYGEMISPGEEECIVTIMPRGLFDLD